MEPERAQRILTDHDLTLAIFAYRVACMVQDTVRADPARTVEASLLAAHQRHVAADRLGIVLLALLDDLDGEWTPQGAPAREGT